MSTAASTPRPTPTPPVRADKPVLASAPAGGAGAWSAFLLLARLGFAAVWIWAASVKIRDPQTFSESVMAFKILPDHVAHLATFVIPWTEIVAAAALILGLWTRAASAVLLLALASFIAGIYSVLERGMNVKCGCFGDGYLLCSGSLSWCHIYQNAGLSAVGLLLLIAGGGRFGLDGLFRRS